MDDLLVRNKSVIKTLYQDERKSLKEVKCILEKEYGFPIYPQSTYESKLRDLLKLRKKLKRHDWPIIHHFSCLHGYEKYDVYLNETKIPWAKVWKEIRRSGATKATSPPSVEEKDLPIGVRIVARVIKPQPTQPRPLQTSSEALVTWRDSGNSDTVIHRNKNSVRIAEASSLSSKRPQMDCTPSIEFHVVFVQLALEALPWHAFRQIFLGFLTQCRPAYETSAAGVSFALIPNDGFFKGILQANSCRISETIYPGIWSPRLLQTLNTALTSHMHTYHYLAVLVYVLSNRLHERSETSALFERLSMELQRIPQSALSSLFRSKSLSLQALWDNLIRDYSRNSTDIQVPWRNEAPNIDHDPEVVSFLIGMVVNVQPEWIAGMEDKLLFIAALTGKRSLAEALVARGARPNYCDARFKTAIIAAADSGALDLVKLFARNCDVNAFDLRVSVYSFGYTPEHEDGPLVGQARFKRVWTTNFVQYISHACMYFRQRNWSPAGDEESVMSREAREMLDTLDILVNAGADVDSPFPLDMCGLQIFQEDYNANPEWVPSCLDIAFYTCKPVFERLRQKSSTRPDLSLTRCETCNAAMNGSLSLETYLGGLSAYSKAQKARYLELVLLEQIFLQVQESETSHRSFINETSSRIVRVLLETGTSITSCSYGMRTFQIFTKLCVELCVDLVQLYTLNEDIIFIVHHIMRMERSTPASLLAGCVDSKGTEVLEAITWSCADYDTNFAKIGGQALIQAATSNNFEAVAWLLRKGADPNSEPTRSHQKITVIGHVLQYFKSRYFISCFDISRLLISSGARIRRRLSDDSCYPLLEELLLQPTCLPVSQWSGIFPTIQFLGEYPEELDRLTSAEWNSVLGLAGAWARAGDHGFVNLFENLFRKRFTPNSAPVLAPLILSGGSEQLIWELLGQGTNINEVGGRHTPLEADIISKRLHLTHQLIGLGAHVNTSPHQIQFRGGALSEACNLPVHSERDRLQKMSFIETLIGKGADVNGRSHSTTPQQLWWLYTPLSSCAFRGDLEAAAVLLQHQADPNLINIHLGQPATALDLVSYLGRVDMAQLLLKVGGLSAEPGRTGYDGSMRAAMDQGHGAVAEMIRRHVQSNEKQFLQDSELRIKHHMMTDQLNETAQAIAEGYDSHVGELAGHRQGDESYED